MVLRNRYPEGSELQHAVTVSHLVVSPAILPLIQHMSRVLTMPGLATTLPFNDTLGDTIPPNTAHVCFHPLPHMHQNHN